MHRDIKPDSILLGQGEPVLADFGIAKLLRDGATHGTLTSAGMSIGTVTYMAPEQMVADPDLDGRVDVYSLAAVGYELLAGRVLFEGSPQQVMSAQVVKAPPSLADTAPATPPFLREVTRVVSPRSVRIDRLLSSSPCCWRIRRAESPRLHRNRRPLVR